MTSKPLLDVLEGRKPKRRPVWFMRQAGRYLPEYREVRARAGSFLNLCYDPELAAEITLQPLRRYDLDAAIVFSDILVVPHAMGLPLKFVEGEGPVLGTVRSAQQLSVLKHPSESSVLGHTAETLRRVRAGLSEGISLIGFSGAPWTVASYMIEGGGSAERELARRVAIENPPWFGELIEILIRETVAYLQLQIEAGAEAVQVFDSWAGDLPHRLHWRCVIDPLRRVCEGVRASHPSVPIIIFARGFGGGHPGLASATGANAIGIEQSADLAWVARAVPPACAVQGNLDPMMLAIGGAVLDDGVDAVLSAVVPDRHIFNLGHGIRQDTDPEMISRVLKRVRAFDEASHA
jgi:uroporphyrinogen decarboxylase